MDPTHAQLILQNLQSDNLSSSHWGFTLYRTDYAPESEPRWTELVERINRAEYEDVCLQDDDDDDDNGGVVVAPPGSVQRRVWEAFQLDIRSDKQLYDGADLDALRRMHKDELCGSVVVGGLSLSSGSDAAVVPVQSWVFLVADAEVLSEGLLREGWVKAVDAGYNKAAENNHHVMSDDDGGDGFRQQQQQQQQQDDDDDDDDQYWGWMRVKLGVLNSVWMQLQVLSGEMEEIAPPPGSGSGSGSGEGREPYAARVYDGDMRY